MRCDHRMLSRVLLLRVPSSLHGLPLASLIRPSQRLISTLSLVTVIESLTEATKGRSDFLWLMLPRHSVHHGSWMVLPVAVGLWPYLFKVLILADQRAGMGKLSQTIILGGMFPVTCCTGHDSNPKVSQPLQKVPSAGIIPMQINVDDSQSTAVHPPPCPALHQHSLTSNTYNSDVQSK